MKPAYVLPFLKSSKLLAYSVGGVALVSVTGVVLLTSNPKSDPSPAQRDRTSAPHPSIFSPRLSPGETGDGDGVEFDAEFGESAAESTAGDPDARPRSSLIRDLFGLTFIAPNRTHDDFEYRFGGEGEGEGEPCDIDSGNCCEANGTPGCDDPLCCDAVCAADAHCCDVAWDAACVDIAARICRTLPPEISCPGDVTIECDESSDPSNTGTATASDDCDSAVKVTRVDSSAGTCPTVITRVWTATDSGGQSSSCTQTITVVDTTVPDLTIPADLTMECDESTDPSNTGQASASDNCDSSPELTFRDVTADGSCPQESVIGRIWTATDDCGNSTSGEQLITVLDLTSPIMTFCPADITTLADAGGCTAAVDPGAATATDSCDSTPTVTGTRSDGMALREPYPTGTVIITWTAVDACGNAAVCEQDVTVDPFNELLVDVQLSPAMESPLTRCVALELVACGGSSEQIELDVTFIDGLATDVAILVPCGSYDCLMGRETLHTLRRTDESIAIVGTRYEADLTGDPDVGGDWLYGGNLNGDAFIDILDFGIYINHYATDYGTGDTTCATEAPHADISGNGIVGTEDFTFLQINFFLGDETECCSAAGRQDGDAPVDGPVTRISVQQLAQRGLSELAIADLNGDGWLDQSDMAAFMAGARPDSQEAGRRVGGR